MATVLFWTAFRRGYFEEYPPPPTVVALELEEGPLFVSYPVGIDAADLPEGIRFQLRWTDGVNRFGNYNLPVFGAPSS